MSMFNISDWVLVDTRILIYRLLSYELRAIFGCDI